LDCVRSGYRRIASVQFCGFGHTQANRFGVSLLAIASCKGVTALTDMTLWETTSSSSAIRPFGLNGSEFGYFGVARDPGRAERKPAVSEDRVWLSDTAILVSA
jgi:hypothetical protein